MIIVSQGNNIIANFDNITSLDIDKCNGRYIVECNFTNKNNIYLGEYVTEERAKGVLQEIISLYKKTDCVIGIGDSLKQVVNLPKVYEMPKE